VDPRRHDEQVPRRLGRCVPVRVRRPARHEDRLPGRRSGARGCVPGSVQSATTNDSLTIIRRGYARVAPAARPPDRPERGLSGRPRSWLNPLTATGRRPPGGRAAPQGESHRTPRGDRRPRLPGPPSRSDQVLAGAKRTGGRASPCSE
jgi:hypothetical protein